MEKEPERRFTSVESFIEALREAVRPNGERVSAPLIAAMGVAIYLELQILTDDDELDDELSLDLRSILDITEEKLKSKGFLLPLMTGSEVLGVRLLPDDPAEIRRAKADAFAVAAELRREVDQRPTLDDRVHAGISVHVDEVLVSASERLPIVGGALIRAAAWAPRGDAPGLYATREVMEGLSGFEAPRGRGTLVTLPSATPVEQERA